MQHIYRFEKSHRIDGTIGLAVKILNDFQNSSGAETLEWLGGHMLAA